MKALSRRRSACGAAVLLACAACATGAGPEPGARDAQGVRASAEVPPPPQPPPDHRVFREAWNEEAASDDAMTHRIRVSARQMQEQGSVPRVAFVDLRFPANAREREALAGYGVLRLTAVCRDGGEVPPARVFVRSDEGEVLLEPIRGHRGQVPASETLIRQVIGAERVDALYLMPLYLAARPGQLVVDFAKNRSGFVLGEFPVVPPDAHYTFDPPSAPTPDPAALEALIARDIPAFGAAGE